MILQGYPEQSQNLHLYMNEKHYVHSSSTPYSGRDYINQMC